MLGYVHSLMKMVTVGMMNVCLPNSYPMKLKPFWGFPSVNAKSLTHLFGQVLNTGGIRQRVHINCSLDPRPLVHQIPQLTVVPGIKFGNWKFQIKLNILFGELVANLSQQRKIYSPRKSLEMLPVIFAMMVLRMLFTCCGVVRF